MDHSSTFALSDADCTRIKFLEAYEALGPGGLTADEVKELATLRQRVASASFTEQETQADQQAWAAEFTNHFGSVGKIYDDVPDPDAGWFWWGDVSVAVPPEFAGCSDAMLMMAWQVTYNYLISDAHLSTGSKWGAVSMSDKIENTGNLTVK